MRVMIRGVAAVAGFLPAIASACPACFGADEDSQNLARVYNASIGLLLGATFGLMLAGGVWFRRLEARRLAAEAADPRGPWTADASVSRPD